MSKTHDQKKETKKPAAKTLKRKAGGKESEERTERLTLSVIRYPLLTSDNG